MAARSPVYKFDDESDSSSGQCKSCGAAGPIPANDNEETEQSDPVEIQRFPTCAWARLVETITCDGA